MANVQKTLRLPNNIVNEIEDMAKAADRDFSVLARELLEQAIRAYKCPGVVIAEGVHGRRAKVAGTGIDVWEIVAAYKSVGEDLGRLRKAYHWLTDQQLRSAIGYYSAFPEEIDELLRRNEEWTQERIQSEYPHLAAGKR